MEHLLAISVIGSLLCGSGLLYVLYKEHTKNVLHIAQDKQDTPSTHFSQFTLRCRRNTSSTLKTARNTFPQINCDEHKIDAFFHAIEERHTHQ